MLVDLLQQQLQARTLSHTHRQARISMGPCQPRVQIAADAAAQAPAGNAGNAEVALLGFCSNDYLGLANHPELIQAWAQGAQHYGVGSGGSHLVCGHTQAHALLEDELARWQAPYIPEAKALFFSTGYMANMAILGAMGLAQATLFCDKLNHASLIDGASLAAAKVQRYPHANVGRLGQLLNECTTPLKFIVTDAVFSMDGCMAPLAELLQLAEQHDAWLIVDDAHGFGVLGAKGQGSLAHWGMCSERIIYMATLGKAAGVSGAFVAAQPVIIDWLVNSARTYIYTTASPAALAHTLLHSLRLIQGPTGQARRLHLQTLVQHLRERSCVLPHGWHWLASVTPIQALVVGQSMQALTLSHQLERAGLWIPAVRPPTVPVGKARIRVTLSASHTVDDVNHLLSALSHVVQGDSA